MLALSTPLVSIRGVARFLPYLKKLHLETVRDLLWHFPARYEDFSVIVLIADLIPNQDVTVQGEIEEIESRRTWHKRMFITEAVIHDMTGTLRIVWFNQPYIRATLPPGTIANFSGKVAMRDHELHLSNPTYEIITERTVETRHTGRIVPIYPETKGITSKGIRYLVQPLLKHITTTEIIPRELLVTLGLPDLITALRSIHFPATLDEAFHAKRRFAFEDLFLLQLHNIRERMKFAHEKAYTIPAEVDFLKTHLGQLPYALTLSQKKSLWEIVQDMARPNPMNRLLQGDVGSGKTIVAALAAMLTAHHNYQTAFMAPTEILARQHYHTIKKFFSTFDRGIVLITANESRVFYGASLETEMKKPALLREIANGSLALIIGTHALIQKDIAFAHLAFVIIDEQHRFGVNQRALLVRGLSRMETRANIGTSGDTDTSLFLPHFLSMTATPIPRTLNLTLFGDLDLSLITELPKNRKPIETKVIQPSDRNKTYQFIREEIKKGRQVFVVCPRIESAAPNHADYTQKNAEKSQINTESFPRESAFSLRQSAVLTEVKTVKEEYEKLSKKIFPDLRVAMLHGKMKPKEKEETMREFSEKKLDILVATSVVEVGVDVPNATIMMIEGSERFGLAQLYQFRGRVGRGEHQSYCFLFTDSTARTTHNRLKSIVEAKNGLELAEKDLKFRGPGEFLGEVQTGMPDLAMKALQNPDLVKNAREAAHHVLERDPELTHYPELKKRLNNFETQVHRE